MKGINAILVLLAACLPMFAQVVQQIRPDLCGSGGPVALPGDISAIVDTDKGEADLTVGRDGPSVHLPLVYQIVQVCPLSDHRLLIFADPGFGWAVNVVDTTRAVLIDSFLTGYDPALSPNRRWLVYPKFAPRYTEMPASTEYLLYDFSRTPAENRPNGKFSLNPLDADVGSAVYPLGWKNVPLDNVGPPDNQRHARASQFFWGPDSGAIVFADFNPYGRQDLVFIPIGAHALGEATVSPFPATIQCDRSQPGAAPTVVGSLMNVDIGPSFGADRLLTLTFGTVGCGPWPVQLHSGSFRPATREEPVQVKPALTYPPSQD